MESSPIDHPKGSDSYRVMELMAKVLQEDVELDESPDCAERVPPVLAKSDDVESSGQELIVDEFSGQELIVDKRFERMKLEAKAQIDQILKEEEEEEEEKKKERKREKRRNKKKKKKESLEQGLIVDESWGQELIVDKWFERMKKEAEEQIEQILKEEEEEEEEEGKAKAKEEKKEREREKTQKRRNKKKKKKEKAKKEKAEKEKAEKEKTEKEKAEKAVADIFVNFETDDGHTDDDAAAAAAAAAADPKSVSERVFYLIRKYDNENLLMKSMQAEKVKKGEGEE